MMTVIHLTFVGWRLSHQFPPTQKTRATAPNSSQSGQPLVRLLIVRSLLSIEFPGLGNLGKAAGAAARQAEPANEAIQILSLRSESRMEVSDNHKAGGPLSLNILASIRFGPSCRNPETSTVKASFQLWLGTSSTFRSFMVNCICFAARTVRSAFCAGPWRVKSRRKSVSRLATPRAFTSTAAGKKIHSARLSDWRKLVPGSLRQSQVRPAIAITLKAAANDIKTPLTIP